MKKECAECGAEPVDHRLTYLLVGIDETLRPITAPGPLLRGLTKAMLAFERKATPVVFRTLVSLGAAKEVREPDERTLLLARVIWEEAKVRNIQMTELRLFGLPRNIFYATLPSGESLVFEGMPLPEASFEQAWWLDNKAEMKKRFEALGIPVAKGGSAFTLSEAKKIFNRIGKPVIAKPYSGSGSRHTTLHIQTDEELTKGFESAKQLAPFALIEEELVGPVFRATVVDGKLAGVLRRDPPHVMGDGKSTIEELIAEANTHPARGGPYFSKLSITPEALLELSWQELTPTSVPKAGRRVTLHQKVNWSLGGTTKDVTDETHPDNIAVFEKVAEVLKAPLVGLDFIISDMSRSWKEVERAGVIECNSMPFFDNHHLPFEGKPRNVAGAIWDTYLKG